MTEGSQDACSVRIFGHSSLTFAAFPDRQSMVDRTMAELGRLRPEVRWQCTAELLFLSPNMAARLAQRIEQQPADVALLRVAEMQFLHDYVIFRVRDRWPRLFAAARGIAGRLLTLAGGGVAGAPTPRGWIFRAPRWLAVRTIGVAPDVALHDAIAWTKEALDALLRTESVRAVFISSANAMTPNIPPAEASRRRDAYMTEVRRYCLDHAVLMLDPAKVSAALGSRLAVGPDEFHEDLASRDAQASMYAQAVLQALDGRRGEVQVPAG